MVQYLHFRILKFPLSMVGKNMSQLMQWVCPDVLDLTQFSKQKIVGKPNHVLLVKIEEPVWYTIYHHRNLLLKIVI